ncbi:MAG: SpoIID/LytB domain-containing protein [Muribaculaceae bacterium]|nr:SpoIID/LytB domain-containing protein [Muribaculaceae bacterium]
MSFKYPSFISVGIPTLGNPVVSSTPEGETILHNMLIGKDFHWQKSIEVILPGKITITGNPEFPVINHLSVETYLECVVGSEMNPATPTEFLKAHAIISRSWAVGKILNIHPHDKTGSCSSGKAIVGWDDTESHTLFHVCSDDHCQRYQGRQEISPEASDAIRSSAGIVLCDKNGDIADARFSKCCGGRTELFSTCWQPRDFHYLGSIDDPWCNLENLPIARRREVLSSVLKDYDLSTDGGMNWSATISKEEVRKNLKEKFGRDIGKIKSLIPVIRGASGRISLLRIIGEDGELEIGKELWIRRLLSDSHLLSSWIEITEDGDKFIIKGRGWGHGVGLCQIGAARMAMEGASFEEILSFYYPDSTLCDFSTEV